MTVTAPQAQVFTGSTHQKPSQNSSSVIRHELFQISDFKVPKCQLPVPCPVGTQVSPQLTRTTPPTTDRASLRSGVKVDNSRGPADLRPPGLGAAPPSPPPASVTGRRPRSWSQTRISHSGRGAALGLGSWGADAGHRHENRHAQCNTPGIWGQLGREHWSPRGSQPRGRKGRTL